MPPVKERTAKTPRKRRDRTEGDPLVSNAERHLINKYRSGEIDMAELVKRYPQEELAGWSHHYSDKSTMRRAILRLLSRR